MTLAERKYKVGQVLIKSSVDRRFVPVSRSQESLRRLRALPELAPATAPGAVGQMGELGLASLLYNAPRNYAAKPAFNALYHPRNMYRQLLGPMLQGKFGGAAPWYAAARKQKIFGPTFPWMGRQASKLPGVGKWFAAKNLTPALRQIGARTALQAAGSGGGKVAAGLLGKTLGLGGKAIGGLLSPLGLEPLIDYTLGQEEGNKVGFLPMMKSYYKRDAPGNYGKRALESAQARVTGGLGTKVMGSALNFAEGAFSPWKALGMPFQAAASTREYKDTQANTKRLAAQTQKIMDQLRN